jgi:teichoic acid transport system permease protein
VPKTQNAQTQPELRRYEPFKSGVPPLGRYFKDCWRRRELALHLSRANLKAQHADTFFGQIWLVLNPLLLAGMYWVLVDIISAGAHRSPDFLAHLVGSLFIFYFLTNTITSGAGSVLKVGRLISNRPFPRMLLPITSTMTSIRRFLPTIIVFAAIYLATGLRPHPAQLLAIPAFILIAAFSFGLGTLAAVVQVYFRDLANLLPYILRLTMYVSPVLYFADDVPAVFDPINVINPLFPLLTLWSDPLVRGTIPPLSTWLIGGAWALGSLILGILFFTSRERDFATRI